MRIVSIDPSLTSTGYAVWDIKKNWDHNKHSLIYYDWIKPKKGDDVYSRLSYLRGKLNSQLQKHLISLVVYEKPCEMRWKGGPKQNDKYKKAVENIRIVCEDYFLGNRENIIGIYPQTWKGTQNKAATIRKVNAFLEDDIFEMKENDIADAIGIGLWFLERQGDAPINYTFTG